MINFISPVTPLVFLIVYILFPETTRILYSGYLVLNHLLIEIENPFKSWEQIWNHKIFV